MVKNNDIFSFPTEEKESQKPKEVIEPSKEAAEEPKPEAAAAPEANKDATPVVPMRNKTPKKTSPAANGVSTPKSPYADAKEGMGDSFKNVYMFNEHI